MLSYVSEIKKLQDVGFPPLRHDHPSSLIYVVTKGGEGGGRKERVQGRRRARAPVGRITKTFLAGGGL